jgi:hypothetical protein
MSGMLCAHVAVLAVFDAIVRIISVKGFVGTSAPRRRARRRTSRPWRDYQSVRVHGRYKTEPSVLCGGNGGLGGTARPARPKRRFGNGLGLHDAIAVRMSRERTHG